MNEIEMTRREEIQKRIEELNTEKEALLQELASLRSEIAAENRSQFLGTPVKGRSPNRHNNPCPCGRGKTLDSIGKL